MSRRQRYTRNLGRALRAPLPVRETRMWIRFEHADEPFGVFSYLSDARPAWCDDERAEVDAIRDWFGTELVAPDMADHERCWFKGEAVEHVTRARRLVELVRRAGIEIVERQTSRIPGKVRYEDAHQVALVTYRDAPRAHR